MDENLRIPERYFTQTNEALCYTRVMEKDTLIILRESGLKATTPRVAILKVFAKNHLPINAEHIYQKVKISGINEATVYRTLLSFEEKNIIKRIDLRKDSLYYELAGHHHHHMICIECGTIEDFETCKIGSISKDLLEHSKKFALIKDHSLELFGICKACDRK